MVFKKAGENTRQPFIAARWGNIYLKKDCFKRADDKIEFATTVIMMHQ
jgi:hypothetical protein